MVKLLNVGTASFVTLEEAAKPGRKGSVLGPRGRGSGKISLQQCGQAREKSSPGAWRGH